MRKNIFFLLVYILCFKISLIAGDNSQLNVIGFSSQGDYLAYETFGVYDGSGTPYANFFVVDTNKNDFVVISRLTGEPNENIAIFRNENLKKIEKKLQTYQIEKENLGVLRIHYTIYDQLVDTHKARFIIPFHNTYDIILNEYILENDPDTTSPVKIFTLILKNNAGDKKTLQKDTSLPKSRGKVFSYRIERIYTYNKNVIAVFLNAYSPGFEGPNMRYLIVTGSIDF